MTNKYMKLFKVDANCMGDVYTVFDAFAVNGVRANAVKKLLAGGDRGYKSVKQDLEEAIVCIQREIAMLDTPASIESTTVRTTGLDAAYD